MPTMREIRLSSSPSSSPSPPSSNFSSFRTPHAHVAEERTAVDHHESTSISIGLQEKAQFPTSSIVTSGLSRRSSSCSSSISEASVASPVSPWSSPSQHARITASKRSRTVIGVLAATALMFCTLYGWTSSLVSPLTQMLGFSYADGRLEPKWSWARDIDFVYTVSLPCTILGVTQTVLRERSDPQWVNGSEPEHAALRVKHGGKLGTERDRDNDELRYSLRSLEQFLPWHTGKIYLVSPAGHIPTWLDTSNPR